jgi:hypothetical protein
MSQAFPFSAIVGQDEMKQAILLSAVDPSIGGVLAVDPSIGGVLAIDLSSRGRNLLMWFRREQRAKLTWAGDPAKPMVDNDPLTLSPRRSFEAWSEIVRGTAAPWSRADLALARAIGSLAARRDHADAGGAPAHRPASAGKIPHRGRRVAGAAAGRRRRRPHPVSQSGTGRHPAGRPPASGELRRTGGAVR